MLSTPEIEPLFRRQGHGVEDGVLGEPTALAKNMGLLAGQEPDGAAGVAWAASPGAAEDG
jgi:hypothetical protein